MDFKEIINEMERHGMKVPTDRVNLRINGAHEILKNAMTYFIGCEKKEMQWLPEYEKVANWLEDNQGKGLLLYGNCGRGKSILCRYALPAILLKYSRKVVKVCDKQELNTKLDDILSRHIISLDDIGTEEEIVDFGVRRMAFAEVMDMTEKQGKLIIISTNLSDEQLRARYGERVLDRIIATTTRVLFRGESLRK
jgi:DNA replication protein DnaC